MGLQNISEHTGCLFYANEGTALFHQYRLGEGESVCPSNRTKGMVMYILRGSVEVFMDGVSVSELERGFMTFLPHDGRYLLKALSPASVMTCSLSLHLPLCSRYSFMSLLRDYEMSAFGPVADDGRTLYALNANKRVRFFFSNLDSVLSDGLNGVPYHEMKRQELLLLIKAYYSKEELFGLFGSILSKDDKFKRFILHNYKKVSDVKELASMASMSLRSFQRKFKAEFDCSFRDWIIARKSEYLLRELKSTDKSLFDIAMDFGFSGMSYFTTFCKRNLGMTPSELRASRAVEQVQHKKNHR